MEALYMKSYRLSSRFPGIHRDIIMALIFIVFLSSSSAFAASSTPSATTVTIFITDEKGRWSPEVEEEMYSSGISIPPSKTATPLSINLVSPKNALNEKAVTDLTAEQCTDLIRFPGALLASKKAGSIFDVEYLLIVKLFKADNRWFAESIACHIPDGDTEYLGLKSDRDSKKTMDLVISEIPAVVELMRETLVMPVVGSDVGNIFHRKGAEHITSKGDRQEFINSRLARKSGYRPCSICFPEKTRYSRNDSLEIALGRELSATVESYYTISENQNYRERVQRIGQQIVKSCDLKDFTYRFRVLDTDVVNAYSVPAGGVYITRGLLELVESDDELGGIIAHEIAHTECHHGVKMYRRARNNSYLGTILVIATGSPWTQFFAGFVNNFFLSGWSRGFEAEADRTGIIFMFSAGMDPVEYTTIMKKLGDRSKLKKAGPEWFRTHPTDEQRLKDAAKTTENLKFIIDAYREIERIDPETALYIRSHPMSYMDDPDYLKRFCRDLANLHFFLNSEIQVKDGSSLEESPAGKRQHPAVNRDPHRKIPAELLK